VKYGINQWCCTGNRQWEVDWIGIDEMTLGPDPCPNSPLGNVEEGQWRVPGIRDVGGGVLQTEADRARAFDKRKENWTAQNLHPPSHPWTLKSVVGKGALVWVAPLPSSPSS